MAVVDYLTQQSWFGVAKETTPGTPVTTPQFFVPMRSPKLAPKLKWLPDNSMLGSPSFTNDLVPGKRYDDFSMKHGLYMDSIGHELMAILGVDNVTGTGPYHHKFQLYNNPVAGGQPPSYTLDFFDGYQMRQLAGSKLNTLELNWSADGEVEVTPSWICQPEVDVVTPVNTPSTAHFVPGWDLGVTINSVASGIMVSGSLTISRNAEPIFVSDATQGAHQLFSGYITVKGKAKFLLESGTINFFGATGMARSQMPVVFNFTEPVSGSTLTFTMSACQFMNPTNDPGQKYVQVDTEFEGVGNTTDAVSSFSPIQATLTIPQSTPF